MQLWSDLDNMETQQATHLAQAMRHGRSRRLSEIAVFSSLREWLLDDYVLPYCRALAGTRIYQRCYWIDALGMKKSSYNTTRHVARVADMLAHDTRPFVLRDFTLEQGSSTRRDAHVQLEAQGAREPVTNEEQVHISPSIKKTRHKNESIPAQAHLSLPQEGSMVHASWLELASTLLQVTEQAPAIFLLNPFGQTLFTADNLNVLYKRKVPTELCLLLSHKQVEMLLLTALRSPAYAIVLNAVLRTDKWKGLPVRDEAQRAQAVNALIDLFLEAMQRHFVLPVQRIVLPVHVRPAVVENAPYSVLFATRRQDSFMCMNDALSHRHRVVYEQSHRGVLAEEWFAAQQQARHEEERIHLRDLILQRGKAQRTRRWPDLRQHILLDNFGKFLQAEYDEAIMTLLTEHLVTCEWRHKLDAQEGSTVPGSDDLLTW
jgi:hypothetical protein